MGNHFSYMKIVHPDRYGDVNSLFDATRKFILIDPITMIIAIIPLFLNRNREIESKKYQALKLSKKITLDCILTWLFLIIFFLPM